MILCLNCGKHPAQKVEPYGYTYCKTCVKAQKKFRVAETIELAPESMREERVKYKADILQRYRGNTPSLEYIKKYGTKGFTKEEVKQAKNVWTENDPYVDKHEKGKDYLRDKKKYA